MYEWKSDVLFGSISAGDTGIKFKKEKRGELTGGNVTTHL
jgi:hypothetical protein